jgi:hypothetical protein
LQQGQNTIRLSNATNWMPDIDYINVVSTNPSGIDPIHNSQFIIHNEDDAVYDLSGRKVTTPRKGINIINGRKVLK